MKNHQAPPLNNNVWDKDTNSNGQKKDLKVELPENDELETGEPEPENSSKFDEILESVRVDPSDEMIPPQVAWEQINTNGDAVILGTLGNISTIIGKAKSRKSFFINIAVAAVLGKDKLLNRYKGCLPWDKQRVIYFDTEQSKYHVQLALKRICRQINEDNPKNIDVYGLRKFKPSQRLELVRHAIENTSNLGFVVIDGIRDLVTSINDEEQATAITSELMKWSEERNIHIVCVLHQNKGDMNARGHIGTELVNKSETVLSVTKDSEESKISVVAAEYCRNIEPDIFAFEIIDHLPAIATDYELRTERKNNKVDLTNLPNADKYGILNIVYSNGKQFNYAELKIQVGLAFLKQYKKSIGGNRLVQFIAHCKNEGWLIQEADRKPYTKGEFKPSPIDDDIDD
jgi:hypothetical protein